MAKRWAAGQLRPEIAAALGLPGAGPTAAEIAAFAPIEAQKGIIAMRPITARIAEKTPEAVIPLDRSTLERMGLGGYKTANIYVMLNGRVLAQVIGEPLVDEIRLRTGIRM